MAGSSGTELHPAVTSRQTSIVVTRNARTGAHAVVTSICTRQGTEVLEVDPSTGLLGYASDFAYTDEGSALDALLAAGHEAVARGRALLGYAVAGGTAGVLLATRVREKGTLPGGHTMHLITDSQWVLAPLTGQQPQGGGGGEAGGGADAAADTFWRSIQQYTLNNAHWYCETADLSRPFPSPCLPVDAAPEFVWNAWLAEPLRALGLPAHCPALMQGAVEVSAEELPGGGRFSMALLSRRSRRHPGTRYIARGLNEKAGPGNECECDLLLWTHPSPGGGPLRWARAVWRRGTVPIWWGVQLQSLQRGLAAEVYVRPHQPYLGSLTYFAGLQRHYAAVEAGAGAGVSATSAVSTTTASAAAAALPAVPVTCVNLLHCSEAKRSEHVLSEKYKEALKAVRRRMGGDAPLRMVNFDWHGVMGKLSEEGAVEGFWASMAPIIREMGLSSGTMEPAGAAAPSGPADGGGGGGGGGGEGDVTPWGGLWRMRWHTRQASLLRFNCADSLDRTNAATCFAMLPVLQEGLRLLGLQLDCSDAPSPASSAAPGGRTPASSAQDLPALGGAGGRSPSPGLGDRGLAAEDLPEGWEVRVHDGRALYVDHVNRRTQWTPPTAPAASQGAAGLVQSAAAALSRWQQQPPAAAGVTTTSTSAGTSGGAAPSAAPGAPWAFFDLTLDEVRERLDRGAVSDYVEMFRVQGDINSFLYTGSPAMHSHILSIVLQQSNRPYGASGVGKLQNLRVAVQRRWNNTVSDTARQQAIELFLGLNVARHCPGLALEYRDQTDFGELDPQELLPSEGEGPSPLGGLPVGVAAEAIAVDTQVAVGIEPLIEDQLAGPQASTSAGSEDGSSAAGSPRALDPLGALARNAAPRLERRQQQQLASDPEAADRIALAAPPVSQLQDLLL